MKRLLAFFFLLSLGDLSYAQVHKICGFNLMHDAILKRNPNFDLQQAAKTTGILPAGAAGKGTGTPYADVTIPVVFHIVLDSAQFAQIGGFAGVADRANTQIAVLNADYNEGNADSTAIPAVFKSRYANVHIKYALAKIDPKGNATNGWNVVITKATGYDATSLDPCSDAKYDSTGGASAWDVTKYANVWVINFLYYNILGLTIPIDYTSGPGAYPVNEMGVLLNYDAFGSRTSSSEYFYSGTDKGRTLTHEMGHFWGLFHIWGNTAPGSGVCSDDDGIGDTPLQKDANYNCPTFPKINCDNTPGGEMFMNYLDYSDDACMYMFTQGQADKMYSYVSDTGSLHSLTQHPELLAVPAIISVTYPELLVAPNPTKGIINFYFENIPQQLMAINVSDMYGRNVKSIKTKDQNSTTYSIDLSGFTKGIYFVECLYNNGKDIRKIVLQ